MPSNSKKYFPNSTKVIIAIVAIIGGVTFFYHVYNKSNDFNHSLVFGIGFTVAMLFYLVISEIIERNQHKSKLSSRNFRKIKEHFGLEVENRKDYWGFKGRYNGYFIRIFFDNLVRGGRLGILIYYQVISKQNGEYNYEKLEEINNQFKKSGFFRASTRLYDGSHVKIFTTGRFNRRHSKVKRLINDAIATVQQAGLKPISENEIEQLMKKEKYAHSPQTETFES